MESKLLPFLFVKLQFSFHYKFSIFAVSFSQHIFLVSKEIQLDGRLYNNSNLKSLQNTIQQTGVGRLYTVMPHYAPRSDDNSLSSHNGPNHAWFRKKAKSFGHLRCMHLSLIDQLRVRLSIPVDILVFNTLNLRLKFTYFCHFDGLKRVERSQDS